MDNKEVTDKELTLFLESLNFSQERIDFFLRNPAVRERVVVQYIEHQKDSDKLKEGYNSGRKV